MSSFKLNFVHLWIIKLLLTITSVESGNIFHPHSLTMKVNPEFMTNLTYALREINSTHSVVDAEADIIKPLDKIFFKAKSFKNVGGWRPSLIDVKFDACHALSNLESQHPILRSGLKAVKKYTNLIHECPFSGHAYMKDLPLYIPNTVNIGFTIPAGEYKLTTEYFYGENGPFLLFTETITKIEEA